MKRRILGVRAARVILILLMLLEHIVPLSAEGFGGYTKEDETPWIYMLAGAGLLSVYAMHQRGALTKSDNFDIVIGGGFAWPSDANLNVGPEVDLGLRFVRGWLGLDWSNSFTELEGGVREWSQGDLISADVLALNSRLSLFLKARSPFYGIGGIGMAVVTSDRKDSGIPVEGFTGVGKGWTSLATGISYHIGMGWISEKTKPDAIRYFMEVRYVIVPDDYVDAVGREIKFNRISLNTGVVF